MLCQSSPLSRRHGLDSACGPASDNSGGNGPKGKTQDTARSASRENRVSTKPGAVHEWLGLDSADQFDPAAFDPAQANTALAGLATILIKD
jgi:hypothetical protein